MDLLAAFGLFADTAMLVTFAPEERGPVFTLLALSQPRYI